MLPFNIWLLDLTPQTLQDVPQVKVLDFFTGPGGDFHPEGLFSSEIFGPVGDPRRMRRFGHIDVKLTVFHPVIFDALKNLRRMYEGIMSGAVYATWDPVLKDFAPASALDGETGMKFFIQHWEQIEFKRNRSRRRSLYIDNVIKYKSKALTSKIVVMPAGARDMEVDDTGRPKADEINGFYQALIGASNNVPESGINHSEELFDRTRWRIQQTFILLYEHLEKLVSGKKGYILGKMASRRIHHGTRNVITAMTDIATDLSQPGAVSLNNTMIGLWQMMTAITPISRYQLRNGILRSIFISTDNAARLVDPKTLEQVNVRVDTRTYDLWTSREGLEKIIGDLSNKDTRHNPIKVDGHYLALIYKGDDGTFKIFHDIRELPTHLDKSKVSPITMMEFAYLSMYKVINEYPLFTTRYPIAGTGSIYPSFAYIKTTTQSEQRRPLDDNWEIDFDEPMALEFPITGISFYDTVSPHSTRLAAMKADFDGDMTSNNATYTKESILEVKAFYKKRRAYIGTDGNVRASFVIPPVELTFHNFTGDR